MDLLALIVHLLPFIVVVVGLETKCGAHYRNTSREQVDCPKYCRFYQIHWNGICQGIFHEATCPMVCGETLQEIYDRRRLSHYVVDDWSMNECWEPSVRKMNSHQPKPDLGVAATCTLYNKTSYICLSTVLPPPVEPWARKALAVASNNTRTTTSPDLQVFCVCDMQCMLGVRINATLSDKAFDLCPCPKNAMPPPPESSGYNKIYTVGV